jgi:hypothetical protein
MANGDKKCSAKDHEEINATTYCPECNKNLCNKCEIFHSKLFQLHHPYKLGKDTEIFTGFCNINNHNQSLEFFCKNHNVLCCGLCICKIKNNGIGQHGGCDVCTLEEIKDQKIKLYSDNLNKLENMSKTIEAAIEESKKIFQKLSEIKEESQKNIQEIFTILTNIINKREEELLSELNSKYENIGFREGSIKIIEKLPNKIEKTLEYFKGNKGEINLDMNNKNKLGYIINNCLMLENNARDINQMTGIIANYKNLKNCKLVFYLEEDKKINELQKLIEKFGDIKKKLKLLMIA